MLINIGEQTTARSCEFLAPSDLAPGLAVALQDNMLGNIVLGKIWNVIESVEGSGTPPSVLVVPETGTSNPGDHSSAIRVISRSQILAAEVSFLPHQQTELFDSLTYRRPQKTEQRKESSVPKGTLVKLPGYVKTTPTTPLFKMESAA